MIRSTTDEMLAARHDPEPWLRRSGVRYPHSPLMLLRSPLTEEWEFAPRVECIPSRDPFPYVERGGTGRRYTHPEQAPSINMRWRPRLQYARPEPNPILVQLRGEHELVGHGLPQRARSMLSDLDRDWRADFTPDQIADARKVLARLAAVTR